MSLGETIRTLRNAKNMAQSDLAEALNVSRQSISKWETDGAVPDLDKLVSMSDIFGVTLDALVKGESAAAEPPAPETAEGGAAANPPGTPLKAGKVVGIVLLCFGALVALSLFIMGGTVSAALYAAPFLLCGVICLTVQHHAGLWCGWLAFLCVDFYLRYATGITWQIVFQTLRFTAEMNYVRLAIGWGQLVCILLLLCLTLRAFRTRVEPWDKKHISLTLAGLALLAAVAVAQQSILSYWHSLPYEQVNDRWYLWLRFVGDWMQLGLLTLFLVKGASLLRGRKKK